MIPEDIQRLLRLLRQIRGALAILAGLATAGLATSIYFGGGFGNESTWTKLGFLCIGSFLVYFVIVAIDRE